MSERRLGPYRLLRALGKGGMGEVWEAEGPGGEKVALKWLVAGAPRQRFLDELRIGKALAHPNLVRVLDSGVDDGHPWFTMPLLDGATLSALRECEPSAWPEGLVLELARQLLDGLSALHQAEVVHRDIKPSNLFLGRDGTLRLIDFGIALALDDERTKTSTGTMVGSVRYASLEQAKGEAIDARTDVHAAGLVLFELLAGRRAHDEPNEVAVLSAVMFQPPPQLAAVRHDVTPKIAEAVSWALRRDRRERPVSAAALQTALFQAGVRPWERTDVAAWMAKLDLPLKLARASALQAETASRPVEALEPPSRGFQLRRWMGWVPAAVFAGLLALFVFGSQRSAVEAPVPVVATPTPVEVAVAVPVPSTPEPEVEPAVEPIDLAPTRSAKTPRRPAQTGWVTVSVDQGWGTVSIDKKKVGETPLFRHALAVGTHRIELVASDGRRTAKTVSVKPGEETRVPLQWK